MDSRPFANLHILNLALFDVETYCCAQMVNAVVASGARVYKQHIVDLVVLNSQYVRVSCNKEFWA